MATLTWLDVDGNLDNTANWGGSTPSNNDTLRFLRGSQKITSGLSHAALTGLTIETGREWYGQIGSAASPLVLGNTAAIKINSPGSRQNVFSFSGATLTRATILETNDSMYSAAFVAGTLSAVDVKNCRSLYFGAVTLTALQFAPDLSNAQAVIETGATVASILQGGGYLQLNSGVSTLLDVFGGTCDFKGPNGGTIAALQVSQNARFDWNSPGSIITLATLKGGVIDGSRDDYAKTLTNANAYSGILDLNNGPRNYTVSNAIKSWGAIVRGTVNVTYYLEPSGTGQGIAIAGK